MDMNIRCQDRKPYRDTLLVQDGWTPEGARIMREVPNVMSKSGKFDNREIEPGCEGCRWRTETDVRDTLAGAA